MGKRIGSDFGNDQGAVSIGGGIVFNEYGRSTIFLNGYLFQNYTPEEREAKNKRDLIASNTAKYTSFLKDRPALKGYVSLADFVDYITNGTPFPRVPPPPPPPPTPPPPPPPTIPPVTVPIDADAIVPPPPLDVWYTPESIVDLPYVVPYEYRPCLFSGAFIAAAPEYILNDFPTKNTYARSYNFSTYGYFSNSRYYRVATNSTKFTNIPPPNYTISEQHPVKATYVCSLAEANSQISEATHTGYINMGAEVLFIKQGKVVGQVYIPQSYTFTDFDGYDGVNKYFKPHSTSATITEVISAISPETFKIGDLLNKEKVYRYVGETVFHYYSAGSLWVGDGFYSSRSQYPRPQLIPTHGHITSSEYILVLADIVYSTAGYNTSILPLDVIQSTVLKDAVEAVMGSYTVTKNGTTPEYPYKTITISPDPILANSTILENAITTIPNTGWLLLNANDLHLHTTTYDYWLSDNYNSPWTTVDPHTTDIPAVPSIYGTGGGQWVFVCNGVIIGGLQHKGTIYNDNDHNHMTIIEFLNGSYPVVPEARKKIMYTGSIVTVNDANPFAEPMVIPEEEVLVKVPSSTDTSLEDASLINAFSKVGIIDTNHFTITIQHRSTNLSTPISSSIPKGLFNSSGGGEGGSNA